MKRGRAYEEAKKLGDRYPIRYSEADRRVVVERFDFPDGWSPRFAKLRYDLPTTYPRGMPTVYIPRDMSHCDGKPRHLLRGIGPGSREGSWSKWCIEDQNVGWDPASDTLVKLTTMMRASLSAPNSDNPFAEGRA